MSPLTSIIATVPEQRCPRGYLSAEGRTAKALAVLSPNTFWRFGVKAEKENIVKMKAGGEENALLVKMERAKARQSPVANSWGNRPLTDLEEAPEAQAFVPPGNLSKKPGSQESPGSPTLPKYLHTKIFLIRKCCNYEEV